MKSEVINIGSRSVGKEQPVFIIAEAGVNHNGDVKLAIELIKEAKKAGADCVKFQTFKADRIVTQNSPKAAYQLKTTDENESQFDMLKQLELNLEDYKFILDECQRQDILFLSTPYNHEDADFLNQLGVEAFKIASGQFVEYPFLSYLASFNKPLILSTGMCTEEEVRNTLNFLKDHGDPELILLQCTTNYPASITDANINAMVSMGLEMDVMIGYSDHVPNSYACMSAVALGAQVIEKHFTLDTTMSGPDHSSSLNPEQFALLVEGIRQVEKSLGSSKKQPTQAEQKNTFGMRRCMIANQGLQIGHVLQKEDIGFKRPMNGLSPTRFYEILGKRIVRDLEKDEPITEDVIDW
ncbi:N-acetylneuraminate synthase [Ekhidna sp.]|uniref:N-acetylneuraminate synthase n=1 Tax=Ekhidna sp. TaxID=2608089 RepID=UPI003298481D